MITLNAQLSDKKMKGTIIRSVTESHLTKSKSVSAVRTSRVILPLPLRFELGPSPGRMTVTKIMPRMTAQTVVVK